MVRKLILLSTALFVMGLMTAALACGNCNGTMKTAEMKSGASTSQCPNMMKTASTTNADGSVQVAAQTTEMKDGKCTGKCPHAANASGECTMKAGAAAEAATTAEKKDGACSGKCSMHAKNASGECTMKAGETKEAAATAETKITDVKAVEELPKGITEGNVYTLKDGTKRFVCPVMQSHMNVADNKGHYDINGKRYYVCCEGCVDKLTADSKVYLDALVLPANIVKMDGNKEVAYCVVSKEDVTVGKKTNFVDYQGQRYYFCCEHCPVKFKKDPEKFIAKPSDKAKS